MESVQQHAVVCDAPLVQVSSCMDGHVYSVQFKCIKKHTVSWSSSGDLGDKFLVNDRLFLAYISSGILPVQYKKFSEFACMGKISDRFLDERLPRFSAVTSFLQKLSTTSARSEEERLSAGGEVRGISVMTDARHASRKNSYHTDHVTVGRKSHKVLNMQHLTKEDDVCTQRHEALGCRRMYSDMEAVGVDIAEHVHDRNMSVNKFVKTRGVRNVNERWHVAKSVTVGVRKLGQGTKKSLGKTWHPELTDKPSAVRDHVYWCIDHCDGDKDRLRQLLDVCVLHFQNNHQNCDISSSCKRQGYIPSLCVLTSEAAILLLTNFIHKHVVYKNAEDFVLARDTYYVESFNNVCLIYLQKRVHFRRRLHYELRMDLAVLDWNEHVDRESTSHYQRQSAEHHRRRRGQRVLKKKSFQFVHDIWVHVVHQYKCDELSDDSTSCDESSDHE